jgi:hypothetical protein
MAGKLDGFKEQILQYRAEGLSVRKIGELMGQPASTVQHALKTWRSGNGESKNDSEIDTSAVQGRVDSPEVLAGEPQAGVEQHEFGAMPLRPAREPGGRKSLKLVLTGVIAAVLSVGFLWLHASERKEAVSPIEPVHAESFAPKKKNGIRVEMFKTGEEWQAVKWPEDMPSPILHRKDGYLLTIVGMKLFYPVDWSTSHADVDQLVPGMPISDPSEVNDKMNAICGEFEELHCGYLYSFVHNPETWDKLVVAQKEMLLK